MMTETHFSPRALTLLACLGFGLAACTPAEDEAGEDGAGTETGSNETETGTATETGEDMALAIAGTYTDEYGDTHMISETEWTNAAGSFLVEQWSNDEMWLVAQNAETNEYSPGLWSRFDWAWDGDQLYYCQSVFDGATLEDALSGSADAGDFAMGCGGFPWTKLN
jgi:hypothetical protein